MQAGLRSRLGFLLAAGGIGLCGYGGLQWHELPHYSEDDLKASTELNLQLDLVRRGEHTPSVVEELENLRAQERVEIEESIRTDRERILYMLAAGAALLALSASQFLYRLFVRP